MQLNNGTRLALAGALAGGFSNRELPLLVVIVTSIALFGPLCITNFTAFVGCLVSTYASLHHYDCIPSFHTYTVVLYPIDLAKTLRQAGPASASATLWTQARCVWH